MFNVGGGEILVILLVALIVIGPQKLPDAARKMGQVMGELRRLTSGFQAEMRSALNEVKGSDQPTGALKPATPPEQAAADALAASDVPASEAAGGTNGSRRQTNSDAATPDPSAPDRPESPAS